MSVCVARISSTLVLLVASNGRCCMWANRRTDSCYFGLAVLLACQKQLRLHWPAFDVLFLDQCKKKVNSSIGRAITITVRFCIT